MYNTRAFTLRRELRPAASVRLLEYRWELSNLDGEAPQHQQNPFAPLDFFYFAPRKRLNALPTHSPISKEMRGQWSKDEGKPQMSTPQPTLPRLGTQTTPRPTLPYVPRPSLPLVHPQRHRTLPRPQISPSPPIKRKTFPHYTRVPQASPLCTAEPRPHNAHEYTGQPTLCTAANVSASSSSSSSTRDPTEALIRRLSRKDSSSSSSAVAAVAVAASSGDATAAPPVSSVGAGPSDPSSPRPSLCRKGKNGIQRWCSRGSGLEVVGGGGRFC